MNFLIVLAQRSKKFFLYYYNYLYSISFQKGIEVVYKDSTLQDLK